MLPAEKSAGSSFKQHLMVEWLEESGSQFDEKKSSTFPSYSFPLDGMRVFGYGWRSGRIYPNTNGTHAHRSVAATAGNLDFSGSASPIAKKFYPA
jgi:hypothetical protein